VRLDRQLFCRSKALRALEARLDRRDAWTRRSSGGGSTSSTAPAASTASAPPLSPSSSSSLSSAVGIDGAIAGNGVVSTAAAAGSIEGSSAVGSACYLDLRISPPHVVNLPVHVCEALGLPPEEEVHFAWVYPVPFEGGQGVETSEQSSPVSKHGADSEADLAADSAAVGDEVDQEDPDVSFLTVGGYIYFRPGRGPEPGLDTRTPLMGARFPRELDLLSARAIRFSPSGALQFSSPRRWEPRWTKRLVQQGRFQPITARKWVSAGARYLCWVRPDEPLPDACGRTKHLAHHGGFAFLFHGLEEPDTDQRDRYFAIVAEPDLARGERASSVDPDIVRCTTSLPFNLMETPRGHTTAQLEKLLELARRERWALVRHLLAEYPHFAAEKDAKGITLLHICAERNIMDAELLTSLKDHGSEWESTDDLGRTPESLASRSFRALARTIWGLSPDLFEDPEGWFRFWDRNANGVLEPEELGHALASAYHCDDVAVQWVKSYVNVNHRSGVDQANVLGPRGLLHMLQTSEEFAGLRQKRKPPLFLGRDGPLRDSDHVCLLHLEEQLERLRGEYGWQAGKPAPRQALPLPLPAPSPEGSADPEERMRTARGILGFTFEQTRGLSGHAWRGGFRIDFAGQQGLDDGGLTKAWAAEIAFALWGDNVLFDARPPGVFFKPDDVEALPLDGVQVPSVDIYSWTGRFVAYALYQRCLVDCRLCAWVFRFLSRAGSPRHFFHSRFATPEWDDSHEGEDSMLADLASLDHTVANNLWRVRHEMSEEDLRWLDFTCAGVELEPGGGDRQVTGADKAVYVRLFCTFLLKQRCQTNLQAFVSGFFDVLPARLLQGVPEEGVLRLLAGRAEVSDLQLSELEAIVVPAGLVPTKLRDHPKLREAARWFFQSVRAGDHAFRARLLEFWLGVGRLPLAGVATLRPRPRLQIMVQADGPRGVKRIASWQEDRLPEGHTCGNELWLSLPESYAQLHEKLHLAVENFEAGFALR